MISDSAASLWSGWTPTATTTWSKREKVCVRERDNSPWYQTLQPVYGQAGRLRPPHRGQRERVCVTERDNSPWYQTLQPVYGRAGRLRPPQRGPSPEHCLRINQLSTFKVWYELQMSKTFACLKSKCYSN